MSAQHLIAQLAAQGIDLWVEGDRLRFRAPKGALGASQRAELSSRRADLIAQLRADAAASRVSCELSFSQRSLWFLHQQAPESSAYHVAMAARVVSAVDTPALRQSLQALVDRHAVLRTLYVFDGASPSQQILGHLDVALRMADASGCDEAALRTRVEADYRRAFDLEHGPVFRATLFTRAPSDHVLLLTVHHIAADGWSLLLLVEELRRLYAEATGGPAAGLARPSVSFADVAAWQAQALAGEEGERLWAHWHDRLAAPRSAVALPTDRPRPPLSSFRGGSVALQLDEHVTARVRELSRAQGTTTFVVLLASFQAFLHVLSGTEDVIVGTPTFARSKPEYMSVVGDFVNSVPLRARLSGEMRFRDLVAQLRQTVLAALDAQDFPLPLLVQRLQPERDSGRAPLFDTFFALQRFDQFRELEQLLVGSDGGPAIEFGNLRLAPYPLNQQEGQFDLALQMIEQGGVYHGALKYSSDLYDEGTVQALARTYVALVAAAFADPDIALRDLPRGDAAGGPARQAVGALLERLARRDIRLQLEGEKLKVNAPKGAIDDEVKSAIAAHRDDIVQSLREATGAAPRALPRGGPLPLSSAQQRLWFLDRIDPGRAHYNVGMGMVLRGALDVPLLRQALRAVVARHEALRSRFLELDGAPAVEVLATVEPGFTLADVSSLPASAREDEARRQANELLRTGFDLARGPLCAARVIRLANDHHVFAFSVHHIAADGWSLFIAMRDLWQAYGALRAGSAPAFSPLPLQSVDHAAWEREQLLEGRMTRQLQHWKQQLACAPAALELPTDRPRPAAQSFRGARLRRYLAAPLVEALRACARRHDATLYMLLLAAWQAVLHRWSGQDDIVVGSPVANRGLPVFEPIVGCLVNNLVLRGRLAGNPPFEQFLEQVKQTTLDALQHGELPFDVLVDELHPERNASHAPIFQVLFTLLSFPTELALPDGLAHELIDIDAGAARFDLTLEVSEDQGRLGLLYEYASDLFDESTIARLHGHVERLLQAIIASPQQRVGDLPLIGEDERTLLERWNDTRLAHDRARCVHHVLEARARDHPERPAVTSGETTLSYGQLDERANRLAHLLIRRGVTPGALVAICVDRSEDMPLAMAAVLKTGAAYVPLDPTHPADRLRYTIEDAGVACSITLARYAALLAGDAPHILLDQAEAELAAMPADAPAVAVDPADLAYVIYTSGSTGRPKGVEVEHRNVVAFLEAMRREPGMAEDDVLLAVTTLSFDIAGLEMWLPLCVGARIVVASRTDVLDGERLAGMLERHGVTMLQATPATWRLLLDAGWRGRATLKALCGGEALPRDLAQTLAPRVASLWNMYGPTETTIWSTLCCVVDPDRPIVVGRPIANTRVRVLEPSGQPAPIGVPGELCIGGEGVARGYRRRPELTAEKFVAITLTDGRTERVYRTGDIARWRAEGDLEFIGRRDNQVKLRGYRIELGEIETVLASHQGAKQCVVVVREDTPGDQRLVGYVVADPGAAFDRDAARAALRARLPEYMVPQTFVVLPALPLTPNGKIDRKALPQPQANVAAAGSGPGDALMTPVQRRVAHIWRDTLNIDRVGLHDNFFDVGGHSLLLVKLHAALKREFNAAFALVELFQRTTVAGQADRLAAAAAAQPDRARADPAI